MRAEGQNPFVKTNFNITEGKKRAEGSEQTPFMRFFASIKDEMNNFTTQSLGEEGGGTGDSFQKTQENQIIKDNSGLSQDDGSKDVKVDIPEGANVHELEENKEDEISLPTPPSLTGERSFLDFLQKPSFTDKPETTTQALGEEGGGTTM